MARYVLILVSILVLTTLLVMMGLDGPETGSTTELTSGVTGPEQTTPLTVPEPTARVVTTEPEYAVAETALWQTLEEMPDQVPTIRADVPDTRLLQLNRDRLLALTVNDTLDVIVPHLAEPLQVSIRSVRTLASGNLSITGKVNDNPLLNFVMTVSERSTQASIGTEQGTFNLRGDTRLAWIAPARAFNHHVDPSVPDYRIPEPPTVKEATNQG